MKKYAPWLLDAAAYVAEEHLQNNRHDLSCLEIARGLKGRGAVSPAEIEGYRTSLRTFLTILRKKHDIEFVNTLHSNYYLPLRDLKRLLNRDATFRDRPPEKEDEFQFCAPFGKGKQRYGLYIAHTKDDRLHQWLSAHAGKCGGPYIGEFVKRTVLANKAGHMRLRPAKDRIKTTLAETRPAILSDLGPLGNGDNNGSP
jgi:hypothetical protein